MSHADKELYEFSNFRLDIGERLLLSKSGKQVRISEKVFETLCALVRRAGQLVSKDELLAIVWADAEVEENNLDKSVSLLRQALGERKGKEKFIETVRGRGYRFVAEVRRIELTEWAATNNFEKSEPSAIVRGSNASEFQTSNLKSQSLQPDQGIAPSANRLDIRRTGNVLALADWRRESDEPEIANAGDLKIEHIQFAEKPAPQPELPTVRTKNGVRNSLLLAAALALIFGAIGFAGRNFVARINSQDILRNKNATAAPFQAFKIKRHTESGTAKDAAISADGKFIAYVDTKNAVLLKNIATESIVTVLPESDIVTRGLIGISPDNDYIYFSHYERGKKSEILKMPIFGGTEQKIVEDAMSDASLSPDGKYISFTRGDYETAASTLNVAATDSPEERIVASGEPGNWFANWSQSTAWSPDASRIAVVRELNSSSKTTAVALVSVANGEQIVLPKPDGNLTLEDILWLPDGDNLLLTAIDSSSQRQIYRHQISTGEWRRVTNDLSDYIKLAATTDGKTIVTTVWQNVCNLWILPADGKIDRAKQITDGRNLITDSSGISWTPDGKIVYATNTGGKWEIRQVDADGSSPRSLTRNCAGNETCAQPFASPDNRYIVFQAARFGDGVKNIWRMDFDGRNPTQLTFDGGKQPTVTPDSRFVVYSSAQATTTALWQIPIEGGAPQRFSRFSPAERGSVSPDGKSFAFGTYKKEAKQSWQTCAAANSGDAPEKCFAHNSRSFPRWSVDGKAFYYLDAVYTGIWKQPLDGEREMFLEFPGERINNFAFSPDGKQLVVSRSKPTQDIIALTDEPEN